MEYQHVISALRHGGQLAYRVANELRTKAEAPQQISVLNQLPTDDQTTRDLLTGVCFAKSIDELWTFWNCPDIKNSQKSITWFMSLISRHAATIREHISISNIAETSILRGEWSRATNALEKHKATFGPTHWYLRWLFVVAEEMHGSQFRTQMLESFTRDSSNYASVIFAGIYRLTTEKTLPEEHYRETVRKNFPKERAVRQFLEFFIFGDCGEDWKSWEMLSFAEYVPLIDRYEFFVRLVPFAVASSHSDAVKLCRVARRLDQLVGDRRLKYISECVYSDVPLTVSPEESMLVSAWDAYVRSDYTLCYSLAERVASLRPDLMNAHELLAKSTMYLGKTDQLSGSSTFPIQLIWYHLRNVFSKNEHSEDSLKYLERFSSRFPIFSLSSPLRALHKQHSAPLSQDYRWHKRASFSFCAHNPRNFEYGQQPIVNSKYLERCLIAFPNSLAFEFFSLVSYAQQSDVLERFHEIPRIRQVFFFGLSTARRNLFSQAIKALTEFLELQFKDLANPLSPFATEEARRALVELYQLTGNIEQMQRTVVAAFIERPHSVRRLSIRGIYSACHACLDRVSSELEFPVIAYLAFDEPHDISLALKRFLRRAGFSKPSEVVTKIEAPIDHIALLFLRVCTPEVLDSLQSLDTVEKVEAERLHLLRWVINNSPHFARDAETEILRLTQHSQLREALQKVEGARVVLNVPALRESEKERFSDAFFRFAAQRELASQAENELVNALFGHHSSSARLSVPKVLEPREATFLAFASAFKVIRDSFVSSPHSGIEACLSGRIRHGHIIQHLRKPFVERKLAIKRDGAERQELEQFWRAKLKCSKEDPRIESVMNVLFELTEKLDTIAEEVKNGWIQSRTEGKSPDGMFDYSYSQEQLLFLFRTIREVSTVDEFLDSVFNSLLLRTRESLALVRTRIQSELMPRLGETVNSALALVNDNFTLPLRNDLVACRQDVERSCQQLERWFQDTNPSLVGDADFELVARTAVGMVERLNPDVRNRHLVDVQSDFRLRGRHFTGFVHILFFLLDNAVRYSMVPKDQFLVTVTIRSQQNELFICVENRVTNSEIAEDAANTINKKIEDLHSKLDPAKVVKEGGSGFAKIIAALTYEFDQPHATVGAVAEKEMLRVCLNCALTGIIA